MLDKKYKAEEKEQNWLNYWEENKIYEFDKSKKDSVYSIDTPPPTVSGNIHIGHVFSYSQTEMLARYKRLRGYNIFYPFGFDDNGLPTERLVEKEIGERAEQLGREEFNKLCVEITDKYEKEFMELFKKIGFSVDWNLKYKTISDSTIKLSQKSFLDLVKKGKCYHKDSPAIWCNECRTSIAQAELETKTLKSFFNYINFKVKETGEEFTIATTRPELIPAISAVFVNPEDEKNKHLVGKTAVIPMFNTEVKILEDEAALKDKGTGIVMCCTFGDAQDILWWEKYNLKLNNIIEKNGVIKSEVPFIGGMHIDKAREEIVRLLEEDGALIKREELSHEVQVHERCGRPVDYTVIPQWFIDVTTEKDKFLKIADEINWNPKYMKTRYINWVENVAWDWCISRQRYFGVPFPVWYCKKCGKIHFADEKDLPVNPISHKLDRVCECGSKEFIPDMDVMDTWATSAITPQINMKHGEDENFEDILKPMSLRTNASDIIRTWDFYSIVKSYYHFGIKPWKDLMISGFVMAGKGEKISKSKGNSKVTPSSLMNTYSADIVRYWAGTGRLGTDIIISDDTFLRGKKLINKIYNLSKFMEIHLEDFKEKDEKYKNEFDKENLEDYEYLDKYILLKFEEVKEKYMQYFDEYEVGLALNTLEKFFWNFCDDYIEIVKHRLYRPEEFGEKERYSGQVTVRYILKNILQMFSPFFPFVTEEIYSKVFEDEFNKNKSIHLSKLEDVKNWKDEKALENGNYLMEILGNLRGRKTDEGVSLKTEFNNVKIDMTKDLKEAFLASEKDLLAALFISNIELNEKEDLNKAYDIKEAVLNTED